MISFNDFYLLQEMPWCFVDNIPIDFRIELPNWDEHMINLLNSYKGNEKFIKEILKPFYTFGFSKLFLKKFESLSQERKEKLKEVLPFYFLKDMGIYNLKENEKIKIIRNRLLKMDEKFAGGVSSPQGYSEVYINPNWSERLEMVGNDKFASFRAIIAPNGDLYTWVDKGAIHMDVANRFNLSFKNGAIALYIYPEDQHNVIISYQKQVTNEEKSKIQNIVKSNQNLKKFLDEPLRVH